MDKKNKDPSKCSKCKKPLLEHEKTMCFKCKFDDFVDRLSLGATIYEFPSGKILKKGRK